MSLIEGVGDEVLLVITLFLGLVLLLAAWFSTNVAEQPLIRVIILDTESIRRFFNVLTSRYTNQTTAQRPVDTGTTSRDTLSESVPSSNTLSSSSSAITSAPSPVTVTTPPASFLSDVASGSHGAVTITTTGTNKEALSRLSDDELLQRLAGSVTPITASGNQTHQVVDSSSDSSSQQDSRESSPSTNSPNIDPSTRDDRPDTSSVPSLSDRTAPDTSVVTAAATQCQPVTSTSSTTSQVTTTQTTTPVTQSTSQSASQPASQPTPQSASQQAQELHEELQEGNIRIKIRYLDDRQRMVQANPQDTIGEVKRKFFSSELAENMAVRFIFRGQELRQENSSLQAYRIEDNSVVHCLLSRVPEPEAATGGQATRTMLSDFDIGLLMFPLFGLMLILIWYCRIMYKSYFNAVSTFGLIGITFLFLMAMTAIARNGNAQQHEHEN